MTNKKYLLDLSLEIDTADINATGKPNILIKKEINGQEIVLDLPVVEEITAKGFIDGEIFEHYWNAQSDKQREGTGGFWLREKTEENEGQESGLRLCMQRYD